MALSIQSLPFIPLRTRPSWLLGSYPGLGSASRTQQGCPSTCASPVRAEIGKRPPFPGASHDRGSFSLRYLAMRRCRSRSDSFCRLCDLPLQFPLLGGLFIRRKGLIVDRCNNVIRRAVDHQHAVRLGRGGECRLLSTSRSRYEYFGVCAQSDLIASTDLRTISSGLGAALSADTANHQQKSAKVHRRPSSC